MKPAPKRVAQHPFPGPQDLSKAEDPIMEEGVLGPGVLEVEERRQFILPGRLRRPVVEEGPRAHHDIGGELLLDWLPIYYPSMKRPALEKEGADCSAWVLLFSLEQGRPTM